MRKVIRKLWHDPVWSAVIAGVILAILAAVAAYFLNWWPKLWAVIKSVFAYFFASTAVWNWIIAAAVIAILGQTGFIVWFIRRVNAQAASNDPTWRVYTKDYFFGAIWLWGFKGASSDLSELHCICPDCQYDVSIDYGNDWGEGAFLHCEECDWNTKVKIQPEELPIKLQKLIRQKIRSGEWKDAVRANSKTQKMRAAKPQREK
jgi:hypothetical protein